LPGTDANGDFRERLSLPAGQPIEILGSCINCAGSTSLLTTFILILIGSAFAGHFERRKIAARSPRV
jgi:hypothetical protein